jgi:hypothetical protein
MYVALRKDNQALKPGQIFVSSARDPRPKGLQGDECPLNEESGACDNSINLICYWQCGNEITMSAIRT